MSKKLTKEQTKSPDLFMRGMDSIAKWVQGNKKGISFVLGGLFIVGLAGTFYSLNLEKQERIAQEEYYKVAKVLTKKASDFEQAKSQGKAKKEDKKPKEKLALPTGDIKKDYGGSLDQLHQVIKKYPKSRAAQRAALHLSKLYLDHKQIKPALDIMRDAVKNTKKEGLLSGMVISQMGTLLAQDGNCKEAIQKWQEVLSHKGWDYMHAENQLRIGLCYEQMNDFAKAELTYKKLTEEKAETAAGRAAKKYLRKIRLSKM